MHSHSAAQERCHVPQDRVAIELEFFIMHTAAAHSRKKEAKVNDYKLQPYSCDTCCWVHRHYIIMLLYAV